MQGNDLHSHSSPDEAIEKRFAARRRLTVVIALLVIVAGASCGYYFFEVRPHTGSSTQQPPGFSYFGAKNVLDPLLASAIGGPWKLVSALGIATTAPLWPFPFAGSSCESYSGISVWNSSGIPIWTGSLSSGVVPFWSLWYTNLTHYLWAAVVVNESAHLVGPISPSSLCGVGLSTTLKNQSAVNVTIDSTLASEVAWGYVGSGFAGSHPQLAVYYEVGAQQLANNREGPGWSVTYGVCGLPGVADSTLASQDIPTGIMAPVSGPSKPPYYLTEYDSCSASSYNVSFSSPNPPVAVANGTLTSVRFTLPNDGLLSWMSSANLTSTSGGFREPVATVSCSPPGLGSGHCTASGGWYLAVANTNGYWLNLYADWYGTVGWALPNVPYDWNNSIVLFLPGSFGSAQFTLSLAPTTTAVQVSGVVSV